ncbi:TolC family protein [uncultured Desulfobacter sp.]|uniref:TolC family protein n=1 Tax=uncultured Desulfobacter sp. TaxID=240139 RepID=UPI0029F57D26|nr:TolC family protein [uncultured Desulfobacter sp.]
MKETIHKLNAFLGLWVIISAVWLQGCIATASRGAAALPDGIPETFGTSAESSANTSVTTSSRPETLPITSRLLDLIDSGELKALVDEALKNNPDIKALAFRLQSQRYLLSGPGSQSMPKVDAGFSSTRNNQEYNSDTRSIHKITANVSWEIDLWGRLADEYTAADQEVQAKEQDLLKARDALAARVIQAWIRQKAARRAKVIETERLAVLQQIEDILIHRYRDGIGSLDEYAAARTRTQVAKADLSAQQADLADFIRTLELLLGRYPQGQLTCGREWPALALPEPDTPAAVLLNRPDIRAALARVDAALAQASAKDKARLPGVTLSAELFRSGTTLSDIGSATTYWVFLGSVFQPLFQSGRLRDEARAGHLEADAAIQDLHAVVLQALSEVENALTLENQLAVQAKALGIAATESEKSSRYFADRYRQGLDNIQTLLIAKEQEISVKLRLNQALADQLSNRVNLAIAAGTGL